MMELKVDKKVELLLFLLEKTSYSRNKIKSLLKYESIYVNNKNMVDYNTLLKVGDVVSISLEKKDVKIHNIDILYEDKNYLVVNKPSGMLTIATEKEKNRTLYHMVRSYIKEKDKNQKIFIVHRLDKDTSGIVIFCKDEKLKKKLQENWESVAVCREYHAVVAGVLEKKEDKLIHFLKGNIQNQVYVSRDRQGKRAITNYKVIKENRNSLVKILLETGRKNQIRVQFSEIGHPVLGDVKYGKEKAKRLMLVATRLDIRDPLTSKVLSFEVKVPREFMRNI